MEGTMELSCLFYLLPNSGRFVEVCFAARDGSFLSLRFWGSSSLPSHAGLCLDTLGIVHKLARSQCHSVNWMPLTGRVMNLTVRNRRAWSNTVQSWEKWVECCGCFGRQCITSENGHQSLKIWFPTAVTPENHTKNSVWNLSGEIFDVWIFWQLLFKCVNIWTA